MDHPVAHRPQLQVAQFLVDGGVHLLQGCRMVPRAFDLAVALSPVAHPDLFDQALREDGSGRDVAHLVLERGRAGVDDEDEHAGPPEPLRQQFSPHYMCAGSGSGFLADRAGLCLQSADRLDHAERTFQ